MRYTMEDIEGLAKELEASPYFSLAEFFRHHLRCGDVDLGLCEPGTQASAVVVDELERWYPDALYVLRAQPNELPRLATEGGCEQLIAAWRLRND